MNVVLCCAVGISRCLLDWGNKLWAMGFRQNRREADDSCIDGETYG